jgi:hypothetical protein|tara:strand:+ start:9637 stop:10467 length:831 start_codon:yes stop_codon:yes gene_type:complete
MPRNNESRLGVQDAGENTPIQSTNSLLDFVLPTEFVELPTKGKFYPSSHPLHNKETIEIKYMTAKETDILSSRELLKKGLAIDKLLTSLILDKDIKVQQLFIGDKNALLIAARVNGFGNVYEAQVSCPNCSSVNEQEFDLDDVKVKEVPEDIKFSENGTFYITLPKTQIEAECRLLTGEDEKRLSQKADKKRKLKLPDSLLTDQLKMIVVSLNDVSDKETVDEFVDIMPASDSTFLRKEYEKARPDVDMSYGYECNNCNASNIISIPFSANFFWPE